MLDEPTLSLDPESAIKLKELIATLKRDGRTTVFSSHVLSDVDQLADGVAILVGGRLIAVESVKALRQARTSHSRLHLALANPEQKCVIAALSAGAVEARLDGRALVLCSRPEHRLPLIRSLESAGAIIEGFVTEEPSLEEIYLRYLDERNPAGGTAGDRSVRARETEAG
jgi:ABC-type multidrug transport system ATPase subunit